MDLEAEQLPGLQDRSVFPSHYTGEYDSISVSLFLLNIGLSILVYEEHLKGLKAARAG